ncbi:secretion protein [Pseudomonas syringae pv. actinidiae]|nr:secretion protein [Pseudomonas syringae pv. actinidiae]
MAYFVIKFVGPEGGVLSKPIEAITREEAISKSGFHERNIQSVEVDHFGAIRASLLEKRLPMSEQVVTLVTIASKLEAGMTPGRSITEAVDLNKLDLTQADLTGCERASDYLKVLRFDDTAIMLADAGDKAGNLSESLNRAADVLRERVKTKKEFAKPMKKAIVNFVVGAAAGIGFPLFGGGMLYEFIYKQKFPITTNKMSDLLMALQHFYVVAWPLAIVLLVVATVMRARLWAVVRRWPLFNKFDDRMRCKRALEFVQTYKLLTQSGFTNPQVLHFLKERSKGRQRDIYQEALARNEEGRELGAVLESEEWPKIVSQNLKGFEKQTLDGRARILTNLTDALTEMFVNYSESIADNLGRLSMATLVFSILMFALGFYMPMVTMRMVM